MRRPKLARGLLIAGALGSIPGAIVGAFFAASVADADVLQAAPLCATPTLAADSSCVSVFQAQIIDHTPGSSKFLPEVTVSLNGSTTEVAYDCFATTDYVCAPNPFPAGSQASTGWWRGSLVYLGRPDTRPQVPTNKAPAENLPPLAFFLLLAIPGVCLLLGALLVWLAPMNVSELIQSALRQWPDPPRPVEPKTVLSVAAAYQIWPAAVLWVIAYCAAMVPLVRFGLRWAPIALVITFAIVFGGAIVICWLRLWWLVRDSAMQTIMVEAIEPGQSRGSTKVWYHRVDGERASTSLGPGWYRHVQEGDRLDALTNPTSGSVRMVISAPPVQA